MRRKVRELKVLQQVALSEVHLVRASCPHHKSFIINTGKYMSQNNLFTHKKPQLLLAILTFTTSCFFPILPSKSQNIPLPSQAPLELDLLTQPKDNIITSKTIHPQKLTIPSLWWSQENSENKLLDNWIVYPASQSEPPRVDLIVNQQVWILLDYLEQYVFVNRLGSLTSKSGYNIRVFDYQKELLAAYTCNFTQTPVSCSIQMNNQSKFGLRPSF
ncbi:hypothetical protein NIES80_16500 [Dolichospermum planctonicum]|uniref:Uncharacterized protein n=2 Tax=Dolichospermum TaxID=748770 RepID=A0A480AFU5_9CYAN|nr:hypothetical protein NIES80_16500 [Dolichospermum planctonicum]